MAMKAPLAGTSLSAPRGDASVHLDALRGLAAFAVLVGHCRDAFFLDYSQFATHNWFSALFFFLINLGHQWVIVFFVMSGYLVGGSVLRAKAENRWSWRSYLLTRLTRLYMVLLPALLLGLALDLCGMHMADPMQSYAGKSGMHSQAIDIHSTVNGTVFFGNLAFLQTLPLPGPAPRAILPTFGSNGPLWSLSNEFWYYMVFPFLVLLFTKSRSRKARIASLAVLLFWIYLVGPQIAWLALAWLLGALLWLLPRVGKNWAWASAAALALMALTMAAGGIFRTQPASTDLAIGLAVSLLIWSLRGCTSESLPNWYKRLAGRAARSSYTLYLVHMPFLLFLKVFFQIPRQQPGLVVFAQSLGVILLLLFYAQIVYELFEKNTGKVRGWLKPFILGKP